MDVLISFISGIGDAILGVIDFVVSLVSDLVYLVTILGDILLQIPALFSWIPAEISGILIVGISIAAILKIAGRN